MVNDPTAGDETARRPRRWRQKVASLLGYGLVAIAITAAASFVDPRLLLVLGGPALVAGWRHDGAAPIGLFVGATAFTVWQFAVGLVDYMDPAKTERDPLLEMILLPALLALIVVGPVVLFLVIALPGVLGWAVSRYRRRGQPSARGLVGIVIVAGALLVVYVTAWNGMAGWMA